MSWVALVLVVLLTVLGAVGVVVVCAALRYIALRLEMGKLRKQDRVVGLPRAKELVGREGYFFVVNRTGHLGALWILSGPVDSGWPLRAQLAETGILVEGAFSPGIGLQLRQEFSDRVLVCDEEVLIAG